MRFLVKSSRAKLYWDEDVERTLSQLERHKRLVTDGIPGAEDALERFKQQCEAEVEERMEVQVGLHTVCLPAYFWIERLALVNFYTFLFWLDTGNFRKALLRSLDELDPRFPVPRPSIAQHAIGAPVMNIASHLREVAPLPLDCDAHLISSANSSQNRDFFRVVY
ncbi:hypothetical protein EIP86_009048 [Pleurotus ostreatoroseus]|nr:hypothetical protein EIP86_009048 [Pleurotus ostreatoroseus]